MESAEPPEVIIVAKPKALWFRFLFFFAVDGTNSKSGDWDSKKSEVVVINTAGKQRRLGVLSSAQEAQAEAHRLEIELSQIGLKQWCDRHEVPKYFFRV